MQHRRGVGPSRATTNLQVQTGHEERGPRLSEAKEQDYVLRTVDWSEMKRRPPSLGTEHRRWGA